MPPKIETADQLITFMRKKDTATREVIRTGVTRDHIGTHTSTAILALRADYQDATRNRVLDIDLAVQDIPPHIATAISKAEQARRFR